MRFTTLAVIAGAMMMSIQAAPITARTATASSGSGSLLLLPGLTDVTSLLNLNNALGLVQDLPSNLQTQVLSLVSDPTQLTSLIQSLPSELQSKLQSLPSELAQLPSDVQSQLANLPQELTNLPQELQTLISSLPATLQAKVAALPSLIQGLPAQIQALPSALQSKLSSLPDLLNTQLGQGKAQEALKTVNGLTVSGLPSKLDQQLSIIKTTLTQVTSTVGSAVSTVKDTVTTLTGTVSSVTSTVTVTVSQIKTVAGTAVSSVKTDVIALPAKYAKGLNASKTVDGTLKKTTGNLVQVPVSSLLTLTGVQVSSLTDKIALPLDLANTLKL
ncbi:uncharacterized protein BX664DRAFT_332019 [Halteromyces radiatus]|uniref:uncharacterized protein n=1 Tax=Halteromyces radiatus TaxID=101107 RepID=UPI00221FBFCC|nr:uncharacterized protein BX664DRAFT_332019 [Halteromyces radiatus]KAI8089036.1 hypothetical protein BX664DRAFT_332019 [Halteromyces radiatus]